MITIKELASELGVSPTTVSNVINGRTGKMSPGTGAVIGRDPEDSQNHRTGNRMLCSWSAVLLLFRGQFFILCSVNRRSLEKICAVTTFKKGKLGNFQLHSVLIPAKLESKRRRTILQLSFLCLPRHSFQCEFYPLQRFHKRVYGPALNSKIAV